MFLKTPLYWRGFLLFLGVCGGGAEWTIKWANKSCEVENKVERPLKKVTEGTGIS
ncbi:hypothetical protein J2Y67_001803 [Neobacillus niacini]|nr:hypothetical protein [Neobacillus niacini]